MTKQMLTIDIGGLDDFLNGSEQEDAEHDTLDNMIEWLIALRESVPEAHRANIVVWEDFTYGSDGDRDQAELRFSYDREETEEDIRAAAAAKEEERLAALRRAEEDAAENDARERSTLVRLLKKYGLPK